MVIIIGSGKQGSGKSTLSDKIRDHYLAKGLEVYTLKFASVIYEMHDRCRAVLLKYGFLDYDYNKIDGDLLQLLGTEWGREKIDQDIWVKIMHRQLRNLPKRSIVIIDDCRFENEFDSFEQCPFKLTVRLEAPPEVRRARASKWRENQNHPSEVGLDRYVELEKFDMILDAEYMNADEIFEMVNSNIEYKLRQMEKEL